MLYYRVFYEGILSLNISFYVALWSLKELLCVLLGPWGVIKVSLHKESLFRLNNQMKTHICFYIQLFYSRICSPFLDRVNLASFISTNLAWL